MGPQLLPLDEARARLLALTPTLPAELTSVDQALGRALLSDVHALRTLPPWDNSAMDGYALRSADATAAGARLRVVETIHAGQRSGRRLEAGEAARIMTGAPLPPGADAVVMQERTSREGDTVVLEGPVEEGLNVRQAGEDARRGELLLAAGTLLGIPEAGLLYGQGISEVSVPRRPRVAILSTGDELCTVEEAGRDPDRIVDTNSPTLALAVARAGGVPTLLGIARDDPASLRELLLRAGEADLVLTSAGMSVGEKDHVREVLESLGVTLSFWRAAIKPGKPLAAGRKGDTLYVGLPGNPTSSLVTFELFVRPALRKMAGQPDVLPPRVPGTLEGTLTKAAGLSHFVRVSASWENGTLVARALKTQTSGALRSAASATHLLHFPSAATRLESGEAIELLPLSWIG